MLFASSLKHFFPSPSKTIQFCETIAKDWYSEALQSMGILDLSRYGRMRVLNLKPATNFHLLEFFRRIRSLKLQDLSGQQRILNFGLTRFGSFVELKWEDGVALNRYDFSHYQDDAALSLVCSLVEAVAQMHRANYYHGDIKPENLLVVENEENPCSVRLVDVIDFASPD